jgi:hypothetical protein
MSAFKPQQHRLTVDGRPFHFVSYEGQAENLSRNQPQQPPMWFLMVEGRRCPVAPVVEAQSPEQVERVLLRWLSTHILPTAPLQTGR